MLLHSNPHGSIAGVPEGKRACYYAGDYTEKYYEFVPADDVNPGTDALKSSPH